MARPSITEPTTPFGAWLKREYEARGMTQTSVAERSGFRQSTINGYISGLRVPHKPKIRAIVAALLPEGADERASRALLNAGLRAAGFAGVDEPGLSDPVETIATRTGLTEAEAEELEQFTRLAQQAWLAQRQKEQPQATPVPFAVPRADLLTRAAEVEREARVEAGGALRSGPSVIWALDMDGRFRLSEGAGLAAEGLAPGQAVGLSIRDVYRDQPEFLEKVEMVLASDRPLVWRVVVRGTPWLCKTRPLLDAAGNKVAIVGASIETTARQASARQDRRQASGDSG